jgi:hypothetical protein
MDYRPDRLSECAEKCSKAAEAYQDFVNQEKIFQVLHAGKLAAVMMKFKEENPDDSQSALEMKAKSSMDWKLFVGEQIRLLKEAGRRWVQYQEAIRQWDTERSRLAAFREEFKRIS